MTTLNSLAPMIFVQSVSRSIAFYAKLGFDVTNSFTPPGNAEPSWAWLQSGGANLMVTRASHPIDASQQAVIFCLYCDDVQAFWTALRGAGLKVGDIEYPPYHPRGEFRLADVDGFDISVTHRCLVCHAAQQIVGPERRRREVIAHF